MKLAFVEMAGFRGFKDRTRFEFTRGFVVLTGRNGVGKSTVFDAVDFVLTGTINKYEVRGAKGGGLASHIWWVGEGEAQANYVSLGFVGDDGEVFIVTRSRDRGLEARGEELARRLCDPEALPHVWPGTLMQTSLIRDETLSALSLDLPEQARFAAVRDALGTLAGPSHGKRTSAVLRVAESAKTVQETRVANAKQGLGNALSGLTEARGAADRAPDVVQAQRVIEALAPDLASAQGDRAALLRRRVADRKQAIAALQEALGTAERLQLQRVHLESSESRAEYDATVAELRDAQQAKEQAEARRAEATRVADAERERDTFTAHIAMILDHGEAVGLQAGHCPLCDAVRSSQEFASAIAAARSKLREGGLRTAGLVSALERANMEIEGATARVAAAAQRMAQFDEQRDGLSRSTGEVAAVFARWGVDASPSDPDAARRLVLQRQEETGRLEHALFVLEASSAHDRVTALEAQVEQLRVYLDLETARLSLAERAVEAARKIDNAAKEVSNQVLEEQFDTVMPLLKELFQRLRPHTDWREIEIDFGGRVRASLNFTVGEGRNPQFVFSSGQRRAAGIGFLLAIHLSRPWCHLNSLLLDDPVQHVDDYRALNLVEVLSTIRRTGRQVIVAVEDAALADVLCRRLRSTALEPGRRFDLRTGGNGSAVIEQRTDVVPLARGLLQAAVA